MAASPPAGARRFGNGNRYGDAYPGGNRHARNNGGGGNYGNRAGRNGNRDARGTQEHHADIRAGLKLCRRAKNVLNRAAHDYDGHRAAAVQNVEQAIAELNQALRYDKH